MKKTGPSLDWCVVRLGKDENWWVESISDKENWDVEDLGIIDPKQFLHINELIDSMTEFGLDAQLVDEAFFTFEIAEEVKGGMIKLVRVRDSLLKAEDMLFALPDVLDEEKGPYADFLNHISSVRVSMLNELIEFTEPYTQEEMEEVLAEKENNDFLEAKRSHFSEELLSILEFVPEGFAIDSDLEVSDKEEKLLPDEDLKWEEEEREETTPYEGGAPDEDQ
jgi:hypothetical protein